MTLLYLTIHHCGCSAARKLRNKSVCVCVLVCACVCLPSPGLHRALNGALFGPLSGGVAWAQEKPSAARAPAIAATHRPPRPPARNLAPNGGSKNAPAGCKSPTPVRARIVGLARSTLTAGLSCWLPDGDTRKHRSPRSQDFEKYGHQDSGEKTRPAEKRYGAKHLTCV